MAPMDEINQGIELREVHSLIEDARDRLNLTINFSCPSVATFTTKLGA
jgi:hypothetical protein